MAKKKDKKAKTAAKSPKKASKPAAKKAVKKTTAKKAAKPAPKAKIKPAAKKAAAKPQKTKKAEVKKTVKKDVKKVVSKKEDPKLKKAAVVVKPTGKKDKKVSLKSSKDEKKSKPSDVDLEGEGLDVDASLLEIEPVEGADDDDELIEDVVVDKPKKSRGRGRNKREGKKHYDSEDYVRKQVVKIDLTKPLIDKRSRYSDKELGEFKEILLTKLQEAKADYELLKQTLTNADNHGTDDTSPTFKLLEDGSDMLSKEEVAQLASRQEKYIVNLQNALIRIQNKTYGICRVTGKLIPKERLRSVPHATLSIDAKLSQYN